MVSFSPIIVHVDMDAFFAAVEVRNNPHLKGRPVVVGGGPNGRGVVSTCSYEARKFGIHSGMPSQKAKKLCPEAVFISAGLGGYVYASAVLQKIFEKYSPKVQPVSVDEAFLDMTGTERMHGGVVEMVMAMKNEIWSTLQLTCSVGISPSRYLAKLASGLDKPNGVTVMDRDKFKTVFFPREVDALWGVGASTKKMLAKKGIITVADLARTDSKLLRGIFGKNGDELSVMSRGVDDSKVMSYRDMPHDKSMSHETTFPVDLLDPSLLKATILWLSDKVARRMRRHRYLGRTISVKIRAADFKTITRSYTIKNDTDRCDVIFQQALRLIPKEFGMKTKVRLLGVRVSHLKKVRSRGEDHSLQSVAENDQNQLELLTDPVAEEVVRLTGALDSLRDKYGEQVIKLAGTMIR